ncbi:MAG: hypothetical protein CMG57_06120 [Candidatus Marinimicrobia bacterium]|nr:hypothetical protein [Candidatus Neomarinimicrobiota bacterium]
MRLSKPYLESNKISALRLKLLLDGSVAHFSVVSECEEKNVLLFCVTGICVARVTDKPFIL